MKKPKLKIKKYLDFKDCETFIANKLGIEDLHNVAGKTFSALNSKRDNLPYQDFWHFICDHAGVTNGCMINIWPDMGGDAAEDWQKRIVNAFVEEFGEDAEYWVEW